ncbi:hypothetical protein [Legionella sp. CNM-4043-24]|uniref:hypothetical protein n=1 Tax=Legionella sp. CNM-4043-24 TaxID=3421646 RepID=UPI00403B33D0
MQIATNKKELSQFMLDFCGFSLDQADYHRDVYAFHLHIAFRRQTVLQAEKWAALCASLASEPLQSDSPMFAEVIAFAQTMVDEVQQAESDPVGVKLIKTGYLSKLDKARKNAEQAVRLLNVDSDMSASISISMLPAGDEYQDLLKAWIAHLDSLLSLPFVLERLCERVAANTGVNYVPRKNAQMLTALLDTISQYNGSSEVFPQKTINILKVVLQISMPQLPMNRRLLDTVIRQLLPFLSRCIETSRRLEFLKKGVLPVGKPELSAARTTLLGTAGVHIESIQEIIQDTLLQPVQQCVGAVADVAGILSATTGLAVTDKDPVARIRSLATAFTHFDHLASLPNQIMPGVLPPWLEETSNYYQGFRQTATAFQATVAAAAETAYNGLGLFYARMLSFVPESVRRYFSSPDALERLLGEGSPDGRELLLVIAFFDLVTQAGIDDPRRQERLFHAYWAEVSPTVTPTRSFADYCIPQSVLTPRLSLAKYLRKIAPRKADEPNLTNLASNPQLYSLMAVHRLKNIEVELAAARDNNQSPQALLNELLKARQVCKAFNTSDVYKSFQADFLEPAIARCLTESLRSMFCHQLEAVIDNPREDISEEILSYNHLLSDIYSRLKSGSQPTIEDFDCLQACFPGDEDNLNSLRQLAENCPAKLFSPYARVLTPHQLVLTQMQANLFPPVEMALRAMLAGLDTQSAECKRLKNLVGNDRPEASLIDNKLIYLRALRRNINLIIRKITLESSVTAMRITSLMHEGTWDSARQAVMGEIANTPVLTLTRQLMRFAWSVIPADSNRPDDNFLNNFLNYCLQGTEQGNLFNAYTQFNNGLEAHNLPALMPLLSDPLAVGNLLPSHEQMMDRVMQGLLGVREQESALAWAGRLLASQAGTLISRIDPNLVMNLFPYPFLGRLALQALQSEDLQQQLFALIGQLAAPMHGMLEDQVAGLVDMAKNQLYPLLGISIQKSIEDSALHYARYPLESNDDQRDAFAMYYLQYRAIRDMNPLATAETCVTFLFKARKDERSVTDMVRAFYDLDLRLHQDAPTPAMQETQNQLQFLIQHLNFSDPQNHAVIRLALINRYLLMSLEASQQRQNGVEQQMEAINALSDILAKLPQIAPLRDEDDDYDAQPLLQDASLQVEENTLGKQYPPQLQSLRPAVNLSRQLYFDRLRERARAVKTSVERFKADNQARQEDNKDEPQLDLTVMEVEFNKSRNNWPRIAVQVLSTLYQLASFLSLWAAVIIPVVSVATGAAVLQAFFTALGVGAAVGAAATIPGAVILASIFLSRVMINFGQEIWSRRREFDDVRADPASSSWKKAGLITLIGLKCLGMALLKAAFTDHLVYAVMRYIPVAAVQRVQNAMAVFPTHDDLERENQSLSDLENKLDAFNRLLENNGEPDFDAIGLAFNAMLEKMYIAQTELTAANDARKQNPDHTKRLQNCLNSFTEIQALYPSLSVLANASKATMAVSDQASSSEPVETQINRPAEIALPAAHPTIILTPELAAAYFEKVKAEALASEAAQSEEATGYVTRLVSGFYEALRYAGQIFSGWYWPGQAEPSASASAVSSSQASSSMSSSSSMLSMGTMLATVVAPSARETQQAADDFFNESLASFVEDVPAPAPSRNRYSFLNTPLRADGRPKPNKGPELAEVTSEHRM